MAMIEEAWAAAEERARSRCRACRMEASAWKPARYSVGHTCKRDLAAVLALCRAVLEDFNMTMALGAASMGDREGAKRNMDALKARLSALAGAEPQEAAKEDA